MIEFNARASLIALTAILTCTVGEQPPSPRDGPSELMTAEDRESDKPMSREAQLGAQLFVGRAGCVNCHTTSHFSDDQFDNLGVSQSGDHVPASGDGRFNDAPPLLASPFTSAGKYDDESRGPTPLSVPRRNPRDYLVT